MTSSSFDQFVREFSDVRRRLKSVERASQGSRRSVVGGGVTVFDADGTTVRGVVGLQPDGTTAFTTVNDPIPPMPTAAIIYPVAGGLEITWDGTFWANLAAPADLAYIEVHASPYAVYTPDSTTLRSKLHRGGATVTVSLPADPYTVVFVAVTTGGSRSNPSVSATETPSLALTATDLTIIESTALRAQEIADAAQARADQAVLDAADAATAAEAAEGAVTSLTAAAQAAQDAADQAAADASAALSRAEAAGTDAGAAQEAADAAAAAAQAANTAAGTAGTAASAADAKAAQAAATAAQAVADAAKAQSTADTAKANAATANTAAGTAQATADAAKTDAANALTAANGKNKVFYLPSTTPPTGTLITNDIWFKTDLGNKPFKRASDGTWVDASFGDGALAALNVGKLVTGSIAAGVRIIAGPENGTHAEMASTGFRVFREDLIDGIPDEAVRMGTETNDFFGIPNANNELVASIDDTGAINARVGSFSEGLLLNGKSVPKMIDESTGGTIIARWRDFLPNRADIWPIRTEVGIVETNAYLRTDRVYEIRWKCGWRSDNYPSEAIFRIRSTPPSVEGSDIAATPMVGSPFEEEIWNKPQSAVNYWNTDEGATRIYPTRMGRHRFLLTIAQGSSSSAAVSAVGVLGTQRIDLSITDLGARPPQVGSISRGGGTLYQGPPPPPPPPPTQQYVWESRFSGAESFSGNGARRTDMPGQDVVQGWDPSGYNGDGYGYYYWNNKPSITGAVDRVDIYLYSWHWYYNSGGTAVLNMTPWIGGGGGGFPKLAGGGDWRVPGFPKPGGRWLTVPADWFPHFRNVGAGGGEARGITIGKAGNTDVAYYGKFNDARLKIWYTQ